MSRTRASESARRPQRRGSQRTPQRCANRAHLPTPMQRGAPGEAAFGSPTKRKRSVRVSSVGSAATHRAFRSRPAPLMPGWQTMPTTAHRLRHASRNAQPRANALAQKPRLPSMFHVKRRREPHASDPGSPGQHSRCAEATTPDRSCSETVRETHTRTPCLSLQGQSQPLHQSTLSSVGPGIALTAVTTMPGDRPYVRSPVVCAKDVSRRPLATSRTSQPRGTLLPLLNAMFHVKRARSARPAPSYATRDASHDSVTLT